MFVFVMFVMLPALLLAAQLEHTESSLSALCLSMSARLAAAAHTRPKTQEGTNVGSLGRTYTSHHASTNKHHTRSTAQHLTPLLAAQPSTPQLSTQQLLLVMYPRQHPSHRWPVLLCILLLLLLLHALPRAGLVGCEKLVWHACLTTKPGVVGAQGRGVEWNHRTHAGRGRGAQIDTEASTYV